MKQRRQPIARRILCARCGITLADPSMRLYSTWTRSHYCTDIGACGRRAARKARSRKVAA